MIGSLGTALCLAGTVASAFLTHAAPGILCGFCRLHSILRNFARRGLICGLYREVFPNAFAQRQAPRQVIALDHDALIAYTFPNWAKLFLGAYPFMFFSLMMVLQFFCCAVISIPRRSAFPGANCAGPRNQSDAFLCDGISACPQRLGPGPRQSTGCLMNKEDDPKEQQPKIGKTPDAWRSISAGKKVAPGTRGRTRHNHSFKHVYRCRRVKMPPAGSPAVMRAINGCCSKGSDRQAAASGWQSGFASRSADPFAALVLNPPNLPRWRNSPSPRTVQRVFTVRAKVWTTTRTLRRLAEAIWGAGVGFRNIFYATRSATASGFSRDCLSIAQHLYGPNWQRVRKGGTQLGL